MARRRRSTGQKRRARSRRNWPAVVWGLLLGLFVAGGWYWKTLPDSPDASTATSGAAAKSARATAKADAAPPPREPGPAAEDPDRFEFYDMLPKSEVNVPDGDEERGARRAAPVVSPGTYMLKAGSFRDVRQADALKAKLALIGVTSQIEDVTVDDRQYHRVLIGPIEKLDELNRLRARLTQNGIDFVLIRAAE